MNRNGVVIEGGVEAQASRRPAQQYGVYFPEENGAGYLLIASLASGETGDIATVLSIADNKIFVRKQEKGPSQRNLYSVQSAEVRNTVSHPNIPKLISYRDYDYRRPRSEDVVGVKTSSIWSFCNGGNLYHLTERISALFVDEVAHLVHLNVAFTLPEAFVYKAFDNMLSAILTSHQEGVAHNDFHRGNIFLHWPNRDSTFPEVFVGDFGFSYQYPWEGHTQSKYSVPFKIDSYDDLPIESFDDISEQFTGSCSSMTSPGGLGRFREIELRAWYNICRNDYNGMIKVVKEMMACSPWISSAAQAQKERDTYAGKAVNGFSQKLMTLVHDLLDIVEDTYGDFKPSGTLKKLKKFHARVRLAAQIAQAAFDTRATARRTTILNVLQPPLPQPQPATWPTPDIATSELQGMSIKHTTPSWNVVLDRGQFEIRRIRKGPDDKWVVLDS